MNNTIRVRVQTFRRYVEQNSDSNSNETTKSQTWTQKTNIAIIKRIPLGTKVIQCVGIQRREWIAACENVTTFYFFANTQKERKKETSELIISNMKQNCKKKTQRELYNFTNSPKWNYAARKISHTKHRKY